jgi:hypothetical protein
MLGFDVRPAGQIVGEHGEVVGHDLIEIAIRPNGSHLGAVSHSPASLRQTTEQYARI